MFSTHESLILNEIKSEDYFIEKSRKSQNKSEYQRHQQRKKQLSEEYNLTKKFVAASTGNRNQYILALKGILLWYITVYNIIQCS